MYPLDKCPLAPSVWQAGHAKENDAFGFVEIGIPSSFSVRVIDS